MLLLFDLLRKRIRERKPSTETMNEAAELFT